MPNETECAGISERLEAAFWARIPASQPDAQHAASCADCGAQLAALAALAAGLATPVPPELAVARARSIRQRVARELMGGAGQVRRGLPSGYLRELTRILVWAVIPLPLALFAYVQLFQLGSALLGRVLPDWGVVAVGCIAVSAAASWLAVVYGSIPLVAYRRVKDPDDSFRTPIEVTP